MNHKNTQSVSRWEPQHRFEANQGCLKRPETNPLKAQCQYSCFRHELYIIPGEINIYIYIYKYIFIYIYPIIYTYIYMYSHSIINIYIYIIYIPINYIYIHYIYIYIIISPWNFAMKFPTNLRPIPAAERSSPHPPSACRGSSPGCLPGAEF